MIRTLIEKAFTQGWICASKWANRDDLVADLDSTPVSDAISFCANDLTSKIPDAVLDRDELYAAMREWDKFEAPEGMGVVDRMIYGTMRSIEHATIQKIKSAKID